jgi:YHS domain-containing protein
VDTTKARHTSQYNQQTVYFCCARCKETFDKEPERYVDSQRLRDG